MKTPLKTVLGLLIVVAVVGVGLLFAYREMSGERERKMPVAAPTRVSRSPQGEITLTFDPETQTRLGLVVAPLSAAETPAAKARLFAPANDAEQFEADLIGPATSTEPQFQGRGQGRDSDDGVSRAS